MNPLRDIACEILKAAWSQKVFSIITLLIIAGSTVAIIATNGRSAATEANVLQSFSAQDTRTIRVAVIKPGGTLTTRQIDHLADLPETTSVIGFGTTADYRAAANPEGTKVAVRQAYGQINNTPIFTPETTGVKVSPAAARAFGLPHGRGSIARPNHHDELIIGQFHTPGFLKELEPTALQPLPGGQYLAPGVPNTVQEIHILCTSPAAVALVTSVAQRLIKDNPPGTVQVATSEELAQIRGAVAGRLSAQSHTLLLGVTAAAMIATCVNVWGLALARRRDFGRRRALGASRTMLTLLLVGQVFCTAILGLVLGLAGSFTWLVLDNHPLPTWDYTLALAVLVITGAGFAAAIPAIGAALRDPLTELRVP